VPATTQDPLPGCGLGHRSLDDGHNLREISNTVKVELHLCPTETEEMAVALNQARHRERTAEVDDLGVGSDEAVDLAFGSHRNQLSTTGGNGGCFGIALIHGHNPSTHQHQIGRLLGRRAGEQRNRDDGDPETFHGNLRRQDTCLNEE